MRSAGLRSRWPRWPVILVVVGAIIAGGAAAVVRWPHAWWWLVVITVVAVAVIPLVVSALSRASQRRQEVGRAARAGLQDITGTGGLRLPTAATADLEARVHRAVLPIPYIHRDEEDTIRAHLRARHPVLLIGSAMVGKTKMAARVIAEEFSSWPVAIPDSKTALAELDAQDVTLQGSVIWLDDIDRLIGAGGITDGALRRLADAGNVIVGTIRVSAYERFRPSDQLRPPEWDVLGLFEHVFISQDLTQAEQERLATAVTDPEIRDRIRTVGLGEYVGAASQVADALRLGAAGADSVGYSLVLAAADWRRCGIIRPIPSSMLAPLAGPHLDQRGQARLADRDGFRAGLAWATRDINPNVSLLQPAGPDSYVVYDYALELISAQGMSIPDASWAVILTHAYPFELIDIGYLAEVTYHRTETAIQAFRNSASSGHADAAPRAALGLGVLLEGQGDVEGAKAAYQQAIDSGHADAAPRAILSLGALLERQGDVEGAKAAYQQAIDGGHADAATAALGLGVLLEGQGDVEGAKAAYQQAIDSGHADAAPRAAFGLGVLLERQGDVEGAKAAYQQAVDSGHADMARAAARRLGIKFPFSQEGSGTPSYADITPSYAQLDNISARVFRLLSLVGQNIPTAAVAALADLPVDDARRNLEELVRLHLIEPAPLLADQWQMAEIVRLQAQQLSHENADEDGREQARDRLLRYLETADYYSDRSKRTRYRPEPVTRDFYTTTDSVGYAAYADAIARAIQHKETRPPLTIGIKGSWGAGKTSLMRMVQDRLEWPQDVRPKDQNVNRRQIHLTPRARQLTYLEEHDSQLKSDRVRNETVLRALTAEPDSQDDEPLTIEADPNPLAAEDPELAAWRPTVWFNPWMYQTGEQVWAGLAHEIIKQVTDRMSVTEREFFWLKLNLKRVDEQAVRRKIYGIVIDRIVPYAVAALIFVVLGLTLLATDIPRWWSVGLVGGAPAALGCLCIAQIKRVLSARVGGSMSQLVQPATAAQHWTSETVSGVYKEVVKSPDYLVKAGFFYLVQTDVQRVLDLVATDKRPIAIFIDDLDRCSPGTVVQVIEAINLFLAGEYPNAIFVAAMEPEIVAAHIEAAYGDLVTAFETLGVTEERSANLGWKFLEKVVQLPLTLPAMEPDRSISYFSSLFPGGTVAIAPSMVDVAASESDTAERERDTAERLRELSGTLLSDAIRMSQTVSEQGTNGPVAPVSNVEAQALRQVIDEQLSIGNNEIKRIIDQVAPWLIANPREMKRFVNIFRFLVMIDSERGFRGMPSTGDLNAIAKLAVFHIRWPHLIVVLNQPRAIIKMRTLYELLEDQNPAWTNEDQASVAELEEVLKACGIAGKIAERISAIDLRMFVSSAPKIGKIARNYL